MKNYNGILVQDTVATQAFFGFFWKTQGQKKKLKPKKILKQIIQKLINSPTKKLIFSQKNPEFAQIIAQT